MPTGMAERIEIAMVELGGVRYAMMRESVVRKLCQRAGVAYPQSAEPPATRTEAEMDGPALARRLLQRRKRAGLSQVELARRAGIRVETLNRVERGKTTPDFSTIRKLVVAINAAEAEAPGL